MDSAGRKSQKSQPVHGPPLQARGVAANRAVLANFTTILAHMAMNKGRGNAKQNRGKNDEGSRYGMAKVGRQHSLQNKAVAGKHSQPMKLASLLPCSAGWWRECGGAGHSEGGLGPT